VALPATDDFNRGDSGTLGANWTQSPSAQGQLSIVSNQANTPTSIAFHGALWNADSFANNQYGQVTVTEATASGSRGGPTARHQAGTLSTFTMYAFVWNQTNSDTDIEKRIANVSTVIASGGQEPVLNDNLRIEADGINLDGFINGVPKLAAADAAIAIGAPGIFGVPVGANTWKFDDWEGGDLPAGDLETKGWENPVATFMVR